MSDNTSWDRSLELVKELALQASRLETEPGSASRLAQALSDPERRRSTLLLLGSLDVALTLAVLDDALQAGLGHRDAILVRELLGRIPHSQLERELLPRALALLDRADDDAFRRIAELLAHLGLRQGLRELCKRADASADPAIREVASDFRHDVSQ